MINNRRIVSSVIIDSAACDSIIGTLGTKTTKAISNHRYAVLASFALPLGNADDPLLPSRVPFPPGRFFSAFSANTGRVASHNASIISAVVEGESSPPSVIAAARSISLAATGGWCVRGGGTCL